MEWRMDGIEEIYALQIYRHETPAGSRLNLAYLIKELDGTYIMVHQHEAHAATTELLPTRTGTCSFATMSSLEKPKAFNR